MQASHHQHTYRALSLVNIKDNSKDNTKENQKYYIPVFDLPSNSFTNIYNGFIKALTLVQYFQLSELSTKSARFFSSFAEVMCYATKRSIEFLKRIALIIIKYVEN